MYTKSINSPTERITAMQATIWEPTDGNLELGKFSIELV
jgi:hypothetical protein